MIELHNISFFEFEHLKIAQSDELMKVTTDSRLLTAVASGYAPKRVLDIGCGIGVISLLLASTHLNTSITGIDISRKAIDLANFSLSLNLAINNVEFIHVSLELYKPIFPFDLIISNPPYFIGQLQSLSFRKNMERHTELNFINTVAAFCVKNLSAYGKFLMIIPIEMEEKWTFGMSLKGFILTSILEIKSKWTSQPTIVICSYRKHFENLARKTIVLRTEDDHFTEEYLDLIKNY